jgi:hypothetical protein
MIDASRRYFWKRKVRTTLRTVHRIEPRNIGANFGVAEFDYVLDNKFFDFPRDPRGAAASIARSLSGIIKPDPAIVDRTFRN